MPKYQSFMRKIKRQKIREAGLTFTQRVTESVRTGKPVADVGFKKVGREIVAVPK